MSLSNLHHLFSIPAEVAYLNCAYMGPLSKTVLEAGRQGWERKAEPWNMTPGDFFREIEICRELFGQLIGADAEGVALLPSVSYGLALAAANLPLSAGQRILVLEEQFPSNVYVWRDLAERKEAHLHTIERPADYDWTAAILEALEADVGIVALPHCHWTDGTQIDLATVGTRARALGAALVVDGSQSIGAVPFELGSIQPDFLVTVSYKWLLGPYSHALLWVAPRWRQGRPLEHNWIARANRKDFAALVRYTDEFAPGARRFDVGEVSNFALVPATVAALRQCLDWGVETIHGYLQTLTSSIAERARSLGLGVAPARYRGGHMIGLRLRGEDPRRVAESLAAAKVYVSVRGDSIRVSPHVYNGMPDVERLQTVLAGRQANPAIQS